jgi:hypothetical protein
MEKIAQRLQIKFRKVSGYFVDHILEGVEARDGIEPPNKVLQTLPFSFWVPRPVKSTK